MKNNKHYLIDRENNFKEYDSFEHLVSCLGKRFLNYVGNSFNDTYVTINRYYYAHDLEYKRIGVDYIVMDSMNRVIQTRIIKEAIESHVDKKPYVWLPRSIECKNFPGFRNGPIPYTGGSRWWRGRYYRHPKTRQELIANSYDSEYARGKRKKGFLPTSWDDYGRSDHNTKNWKKYRKTQYKDL